jgi:hypothetical protein
MWPAAVQTYTDSTLGLKLEALPLTQHLSGLRTKVVFQATEINVHEQSVNLRITQSICSVWPSSQRSKRHVQWQYVTLHYERKSYVGHTTRFRV